MRAVVLVGGFGTRLRPLTNVVPKSMLPIAHVPLIVRLLARLERGGVDEATLALGFLPEPFVDAFPDGRCGGVALRYAIEPEPLDTAGAIRFAADHSGIDDTFVVANGDVLTDLDVGALVATHRRLDAEATIHLIGVEDPSAFGVVERDGDGRILRFVEKPPPGTEPSNLINAGTYVFEPGVLDRIPAGRPVSVERETFPLVAAAGRFHALVTDDYWIDAGRPDLYLQANLDLVSGRRPEVVDPVAPDASIAATADVVDSVIGSRAVVGEGARSVDRCCSQAAPWAPAPSSTTRSWPGSSGVTPSSVAPWSAPTARLPTVSSSTTSGSPPIDDPAVTGRPEQDPPPVAEHVGGVLVIGGAGFVGSHLVDRLIAEGEAVDVVDDLSTGSLGNLSDARAAVATGVSSELRISTLDAAGDELADLVALRRPREIYHLALLTRHDAPPEELGRSFTATLRVLEAARRSGVDKVVVVLPATALYGHPSGRDLPVKEGAFVPRGVRGVVAKAIVELLAAYRERYEIEFTVLATATVYGPRQRPDGGVVAALLGNARRRTPPRLTGDGRQTRDLVFVDDVVDALVRSGRRGSGLVVNVGTGVQTSLRELWTMVAPDGPTPTYVPAREDELIRFAVSRCEPGSTSRGPPGPPSTKASACCAEGGAGQLGGHGEVRHHGRHDHGPHPGRLDGGRQGGVDGVDDQRAGHRRVEAGHPDHGRLVAELGEQAVGRSLEGGAADDRRHGHDGLPSGGQLVVDPRQRADRPDRHQRVRGGDHDDLGVAQRAEHSVGRLCVAPFDTDGGRRHRMAEAHEVVLERHRLPTGQLDEVATPSSDIGSNRTSTPQAAAISPATSVGRAPSPRRAVR